MQQVQVSQAVEKVSEWLQAMGKQIGLELSLGDSHRCVIGDDTGQEFIIEVAPEEGLLYLYSPLREVPVGESRAVFLEKLLIMNLFGQKTHSASLAIDPRINQVLLFYSAPVAFFEGGSFRKLLNHFVQTAKRVKKTLESFELDAVKERAPTLAPQERQQHRMI